MALPVLFINAGEQNNVQLLLSSPFYWLFCATYIFLFYLNAYLLVPVLFLTKRYTAYGLIALGLLTGTYFLQPYDHLLRSGEKHGSFLPVHALMRDILRGKAMPPPQPGDHRRHYGPPPGNHGPDGPPPDGPAQPLSHGQYRHIDSISLFLFAMIMALSTAIRIMRQWQLSEQRAVQAESDKTSAELSFLKAQINPHFLFNTLNNIYTLAVMQDENAPESILKLSNIMRYVTDDAMEDFVPLQYEIDCINDYIELQRLRLGDKTTVDMKVSGLTEGKVIAPLILMTFIENVFKYGISKHEPSTVSINILGHENGISFYCQNRIFPDKAGTEREGIGLKNVKQRLAYLYPGKHVLNINTENQLFTVNLILQAK
ncbi:MAG TPA: sensor histidine kinase [Mucilaginibacter sp.]|nr:sensor histidine kinase [Mucilaginibacter sp.]